MNVKIKRVYERPDEADGNRILVDRLWPQDMMKAKARVDLWLKGIAPSADLRKWFGHDPAKWRKFRTQYRAELRNNDVQATVLKKEIEEGPATLIYGARDEKQNAAVVLQEFLNR